MAYPELLNIGITRPHEVIKYTISSNNDVDTLRIRYKRPKGSLLPITKRFQFPRRLLPVTPPAGEKAMTEISPALEGILGELTQLLNTNKSTKDKKAELITELNEFEEMVTHRISELKAEINAL